MASLLPLVLIAVLLIAPILLYNRLLALRQRFRRAFRQVDAQLRRRYDLVPNLVEVAKAHLSHDRATLEAVIVARAQAQQAERRVAARPEDDATMAGLLGAERMLSSAIGRLIAVAESCPALAGDETMQALRQELAATENRFGYAQRSYHRAVTLYNAYRRRFPQSQIAGMFGFREAPGFEMEVQEEREALELSPAALISHGR